MYLSSMSGSGLRLTGLTVAPVEGICLFVLSGVPRYAFGLLGTTKSRSRCVLLQ